jgi:hypothetical protein
MNEMDTSWIEEFEKFNDFYKEEVHTINIKFILLDKKGAIENIKNENYLLSQQNKLSKEELIYLIKREIINNKHKTSLVSICQFNFSLNNDEIILLYNDKEMNFADYITTIHSINDVYWKDTIHLFKDLNELTIILMKKNKQKNNTTKKVYVQNNSKTRRKY